MNSFARRRISACAGALLAIVCIVDAANAEDATVNIDNFTFAPAQLTVKAGTTVIWRNEDDIPHTVASSTRAFKSKALDTDDRFSFTFRDAGTYEYFCSLHPHMKGAITVEPATHAAK